MHKYFIILINIKANFLVPNNKYKNLFKEYSLGFKCEADAVT